jgi:tetratricopeptide (TPR) repeat protein
VTLPRFDVEVDGLVRAIRGGTVAVFCGAGISIASGIPSALTIKRNLLRRIGADELETQRLADDDYPFEAFVEAFHEEVGITKLFAALARVSPSAAHRLLADLVRLGLLKSILTTNFDELIEAAIGQPGTVVSKLHGTVSDPSSIAVTLEGVAGYSLLPARERAITTMFAEGEHDAVLVIGYSCSDYFDITPAIEALGDRLKRIWIVEHDVGADRAEDIVAKHERNPFKRCRHGVRLFGDTDALLARIAAATGAQSYSQSYADDRTWSAALEQWWMDVPGERGFAGHAILGQLLYNRHEVDAALRHYRAAIEVSANPAPAPDQIARARMQIAGCLRATGQHEEALAEAREAQRLALSLTDVTLKAMIEGTVANVQLSLGKLDDAARSIGMAVEIMRTVPDQQRRLGMFLALQGVAYERRGLLDEALKCFEESIPLAQLTGDRGGEAARSNAIAGIYAARCDWETADRWLSKAQSLAAGMADSRGMAIVLLGRATAAFQLGEIPRALSLSHEAIHRFRALGDPVMLDVALAQLELVSRSALRKSFPILSRLLSGIKRAARASSALVARLIASTLRPPT